MHVFPGALIGIVIWIKTIVEADAKFWPVLAGPVIVSGVVLVLALAPEAARCRPWSAGGLVVMALALGVFVGSLTLL